MAVSADLAVATGKIIPILCATGYGLPDQDSGILSSLWVGRSGGSRSAL